MRAEELAEALEGRKAGSGWTARCPAHEDRTPSLSISEGPDDKTLVHCQAGCDQQSVIAALKERGLWSERRRSLSPIPRRHSKANTVNLLNPEYDNNSEYALQIWNASKPAADSLVEIYLKNRGIFLPVPETIRFHANLKHPSGDIYFPAMVGLITRGDSNEEVAIHRTFLSPDGSAKAEIKQQKAMLGPCKGGAIRLAPATDRVMVGEGIETCLSVMQFANVPTWVALSATGLKGLHLPPEILEVTILADSGDTGEKAAKDAAFRWVKEGRKVHITRPPLGLDFNDMDMGCESSEEEN
jgi:putative DNA primase/helicase